MVGDHQEEVTELLKQVVIQLFQQLHQMVVEVVEIMVEEPQAVVPVVEEVDLHLLQGQEILPQQLQVKDQVEELVIQI